MPLGTSLSLLCSSWGRLGSLQNAKSITLFENVFSVLWGSRSPSCVHIGASFPVLTPKWSQNYPQKSDCWGSFSEPFFEVLKFFKLGASLSRLGSSWGRPGILHNNMFWKSCFSVLWCSRCPPCVHLDAPYPILTPKRLPKLPQNGTQNQKKHNPKIGPILKLIFSMCLANFGAILGPKSKQAKKPVTPRWTPEASKTA